MIVHKKIKGLILSLVLIILGIAVIYWTVRPSLPDFSVLKAGSQRKKAFFGYFLPIIEKRNQEILETRQKIIEWKQDRNDISWLDKWQIEDLANNYRMKTFDIQSDSDWNTLLRRVDIVPSSLALAQAAKESGWGTSRFARQGYNFYGQWCFEKGCGMVPKKRDALARHEVAIFDSPKASVESYIHNLNSNEAYKPLRNIRAALQAKQAPVTGMALTGGLGKYSEQGTKYIEELRSMIRHNDLANYDAQ